MKRWFADHKKEVIIIVGILILSSFLRFYRLSSIFALTIDEEYQADLAMTIVHKFHIIWIGVNAAQLGFYLGPFWTYFTAFWLWVSNGNPLLTGYISASIGVITTLALYLVGSKLFSFKIAVIASLLYASLPLIVFFDQKYWNPTLVPLLSLIALYCFYAVPKSPRWWIVFGFIYGLVFHIHLSLVPLILPAIVIFWKNRAKVSREIIFAAITVFILTISPLIAFDYFHKGSNILTPLRIKEITRNKVDRVDPIFHAKSMFLSLGRLWYLQPGTSNADETNWSCTSSSVSDKSLFIDKVTTRTKPVFWVRLVSLLIVLAFLAYPQTWRKRSTQLLAIQILILGGAFLFFTGSALEYYLLGVFPLLLFIPGLYLERFKALLIQGVGLAVLLVVVGLGIYTVIQASSIFSLKVQKKLIRQTMQIVGNKSFDLVDYGECHKTAGWRILYSVYARRPSSSSTDSILGWLYPREISNEPTDYTIRLSEKRIPVPFNQSAASDVFTEGGFTAYVFKNR